MSVTFPRGGQPLSGDAPEAVCGTVPFPKSIRVLNHELFGLILAERKTANNFRIARHLTTM